MNTTTLKDFLASVIAEQLPDTAFPESEPLSDIITFYHSQNSLSDQPSLADAEQLPDTAFLESEPLSDIITFYHSQNSLSDQPSLADKVAEELLQEALASGLPLTDQRVDKGQLRGGNTAEVVAQLTLHASFAFKLDGRKKKLAEEGLAMRKIKGDDRLPPPFRDAWPVIYAVRHEKPPYAYLMEFFPREDGWRSLEDLLYPIGSGEPPTAFAAVRWINKVLDILFTGYEASVEWRFKPNLMQDYFSRIRDRLSQTARKDGWFASRPLLVNGKRLRPWESYLDEIERNHTFLDQITPPFTTVTHGDPNPGNLMLRTTTAEVELKLIDPKEWMTGDYLFDVTKITHFLQGTGPIEKPAESERMPTTQFRLEGSEEKLDYSFGMPGWTSSLVDACRNRVAEFAVAHKDPHWRARYELGMAANLLGLPLGRLDKNREHALILFGEGLNWLEVFCTRLGTAWNKAVPVAKVDEIEPEPLRLVRKWVRNFVPGMREAQDRRGFELLQWDPVHPNDKNKPVELSLEHEARLLPVDEGAAAKLLDALMHSEGQPAGEHFLGKDSPFAGLIVRRYDRETGAQSVDRYYDVPAAEGVLSLIPRMITIRERLRGSKFMTWSATNKAMRPLDLELPFIALGESGLTARLEFNWIDDLHASLREALSADIAESKQLLLRNPLFIAMQTQNLSLCDLVAVLEHTTYRQKFGLWQSGSGETEEREVFAVNLDLIVAQDLVTKCIGTYWDVDISGVARVDAEELKRVIQFTKSVGARYGLQPNSGTKAWRDAEVTGLLAQLNGG